MGSFRSPLPLAPWEVAPPRRGGKGGWGEGGQPLRFNAGVSESQPVAGTCVAAPFPTRVRPTCGYNPDSEQRPSKQGLAWPQGLGRRDAPPAATTPIPSNTARRDRPMRVRRPALPGARTSHVRLQPDSVQYHAPRSPNAGSETRAPWREYCRRPFEAGARIVKTPVRPGSIVPRDP